MSLGALTTAFTPAPSCLFTGNIWEIKTGVLDSDDPAAVYQLLGPPSTSDCLPSGYDPATTAYYSPGRCPSGYSIAASNHTAIGSVTETTHVCCPTAFSFTTQSTGSVFTDHPFVNTLLCNSMWNENKTLMITSSALGGEPTVATISVQSGNGALNAYGVVVKFQEGDFDDKTTSGSEASPSEPQNTALTSTSSPAAANSSGLSTGASIGIGVGVGIGGLGALIGAVLFILRRRKIKNQKAESLPSNEPFRHQPFPDWTQQPNHVPQEIEGREWKAPGSTRNPSELDARR